MSSGTPDSLGDLTRTHYCGALRVEHVGQTVTLLGWAHGRRDLGGLLFLDLRDREGLCQVTARPEQAAAYEVAQRVRSEYVLAVVGEVAQRESINPQLATGEVEVLAREIRVLSEAKTPPFAVEEETDAGEDLRLRYRYLDLRRPRYQRNLRLRHRVTMEVRRYFDEQGFLEIETPFLTKSTPEGARDYLVPSRVHPGEFYALPQSPQLFKQILMIAGYDRYFQIVRCFRDEDLRADRQPEFTQVDVEMSFPRIETVFGVIEPLFERLLGLVGAGLERPLPRLSHAEALLRYGTDKPDLRFGLEIADVTEALDELGIEAQRATIAQGARARGLLIPASSGVSGTRLRKLNEELWLSRLVPEWRIAKRPLFTLKATDEAVANLAKKGTSEASARHLLEVAGARPGDTLLVGLEREGPLAGALGALRLELGRELDLVQKNAWRLLWVTGFPLMEKDEVEGRYVSLHHPFTAPVEEDLGLLDSDPGRVRAKAYDLVMNGYEVGGGSIRIHDAAQQARIFKLLSLSDEEARARFGFFLDALQYGTPPHGGIALGVDRIVMLLAGESSLREVIAFPKTTSATDLMCAAPSPVRDEQLEELGIALRRE